MLELAVLIPSAVAVALALWALHQRRRIIHYRDVAQRIKQEKEAVLALMDTIGEKMTTKIDLEATLQAIARYVVEATDAESGAIYLEEKTPPSLVARVVVGTFPPLFDDVERASAPRHYTPEQIQARRIGRGEGIIGWVAEQARPLLITDAEADPRVPRAAAQHFPLHSLVLCPLRLRGRNLGVIAIVNKQGGVVFDARDTQLLQALADQAAITVDLVQLYGVLARQQRLEQELELARDFQRMLLPRQAPEIQGYEFGALSRSAMIVGGDFYDFFPIDRDHLALVIGDVSGKGIPAALIMAMVRAVVRAEAREALSPKEVLRRVNERIRSDTQDNVFVTITYGILDLATDRFRMARAGHEPTLLVAGGSPESAQARLVQPEGMAVGLMPPDLFARLEEVELQLEPGHLAVLYTDGVIEAVNGAAEEYGRQRLVDVVTGAAGQPPTVVLEAIARDVEAFAGGAAQRDDITLLAFRVHPERAGLRAALTAEPRAAAVS